MSRSSISRVTFVALVLLNRASPICAQQELTFDELHAQVAQMQASGAARDTTQDLVESWIQAQGLEQLTIEKTRWCLEQMLPQQVDRRQFSAVWTGQITPARSGPFVFSILPINVNKAGAPDETVRHTMTVFVDGQRVVNATPDNWAWRAAPIELQAGQSVSLRVELSYSSTDNTYGDSPHAFLFWEGPGISRQIVPSGTLSPPDGQGNGLQATYHWTEGDEPREVVQRDPNIEFAWATCRDVAPRDPELIAALSEHLWTLATDPAYIAAQAADQSPAHAHVYFRNYTSTEFLSLDLRRQFIQLLLQTPALLCKADETQILRLYHSLRLGDADGALDMLGRWMQTRADAAPEITQDFFDRNRRFYRTVALYLVHRAPDRGQARTLEDRYLEMADGQCCLPVAYTLAYCQLIGGAMKNMANPYSGLAEWIATIEERLSDESVDGDRRVNWLLARAMAEEIRNDPAGRGVMGYGSPWAGDGWLAEAQLIAETSAMRARLFREEIARQVALNQPNRVAESLDAASDSVPANELAALRAQVERVADRVAREKADDAVLARQRFLDEIRRRRQLAAERGAAAMVVAFDRVIELHSEE